MPSIQARSSQRKDQARWIPPGGIVNVNGFEITGGMVYVGSFLSASPAGGWNADTPAPCLIDPSLKVASGKPQAAVDIGYWPSYSAITPENRLTFLTWLSSGKSDSSVPAGFVFLYFYGLERRLLVEEPPPAEEALLVAEIERLKTLYSAHGSFGYYCRALLDLVYLRRLSTRLQDLDVWSSALKSTSRDMPLLQRVMLGLLARTGTPLTFEQAMVAMLSMPPHQGGVRSTIGTRRCRDEYVDLVRRRFANRFPKGFLLRDRKDSKLALAYRPASQLLEVEVGIEGIERLPDPFTLTWTKMAKLCSEAADDLVPYAKAIGKDRARANTLEASFCLPPEIADRGSVASFKQWLASLSSPVAEVPLSQLSLRCLGADIEEVSAKQARDLSAILTRVGYGMEPDPVYGGDKPTASVMIFRTDSIELSAAFHAAALVSAVFASAEPGLDSVQVVSELARRLKLTLREAVRLAARHRTMRGRSILKPKLKAVAAKLTFEEKAAVAALAASVAVACGDVDKPTIASLERLHDTFGVERRNLYAALHQGAAAAAMQASEPVTVEKAVPADRRFRIPPPSEPETPDGGLVIDMARVGAILRETLEVADLLTPIYADGDQPPESSLVADIENRVPGALGRFFGLDADHARLLNALCDRESWSRTEFETVARQFGLMPDGAIESINEWAYDTLGNELVEDGEPLLINVALLPDAPGEEL